MSAVNRPEQRLGGRTYFLLTDNGDWMEMTPNGPLEGPGVAFYAVDLDANFDELDHMASTGSGELLARAYIQDNALHLQRREPQLQADASAAADPHPRVSRVMRVALELADQAAEAATAGVPVLLVAHHRSGIESCDLGISPGTDAVRHALAHLRRVTADAPVTTVAWTYPARAAVRDLDLPAEMLIAEALDADGTHVSAACLGLTAHGRMHRGPWYRVRATETPTNPWDIEELHSLLTA
jgi:hypothetical protein